MGSGGDANDSLGFICPSCSSTLAPGAVLCIGCGYHLRLGRHLATAVDREEVPPIDLNPYASPSVLQPIQQPADPFVSDLTPSGARRAEAVVAEAANAYAVAAASMFCAPLAVFLFPWYSFRLWSWYRLNTQFSELRNPNSFSPHARLATAFQDAKIKLWVGWSAGLLCWLVWGSIWLVRILIGATR